MAKPKDPQPSLLDMFADLGKNLKMPTVDVDSILDHHRKNLEAIEKSAKAGTAGASELFSKQRDQLRATFSEIADMAQDFRAGGNPQDLISKQADFARRSFETAVKNASEVGEILRRSGSETIDILRARISEAMDEVRQGQKKGD